MNKDDPHSEYDYLHRGVAYLYEDLKIYENLKTLPIDNNQALELLEIAYIQYE